MSYKKKQYPRTSRDFKLPLLVDKDDIIIRKSANDIPMISWPDGTWCLPANMFILELYDQGFSRKNRGGSLQDYATHINHLLRFCFRRSIDLEDLTDNLFSTFVFELGCESDPKNPGTPIRRSNQLLRIGRTSVEFLSHLSDIYNLPNFVGPKGTIRAQKKEYTFFSDSGTKITKAYFHHRSFPTPDSYRKRLPIDEQYVDRLHDAVFEASTSIYLRKRRYVLLRLLEVTGGRRTEIGEITTKSVYEAACMAAPALKIITLKQERESSRYVPIPLEDVFFLIEFIEINRSRIIRKTCGLKDDDGYLLSSERSGKKLEPNTITQEITKLRAVAKIEEPICAHMFRHHYITKLFVSLFQQFNLDNPDAFKHAFLQIETFKQIIQQHTGHKNLQSLDIYIHLAHEKYTKFKVTYDKVKMQRSVDSLWRNIINIRNAVKAGAPLAEATEQLIKLLSISRDNFNHTF